MLSISGTTSSKSPPLNPVGRGRVRRESRCAGHRPPGRLRDSGARLTSRPAHPASPSSRTAPHHSAHGLTPGAGPLSSTAAGRSRLPVLQSGKPSRKTARLRSMAFFIQGDLRPPCSPARDASRSVNALIPRSPLSRNEAVSLLQGALTASLRRVRSSHRHISGITPPPSPGLLFGEAVVLEVHTARRTAPGTAGYRPAGTASGRSANVSIQYHQCMTLLITRLIAVTD